MSPATRRQHTSTRRGRALRRRAPAQGGSHRSRGWVRRVLLGLVVSVLLGAGGLAALFVWGRLPASPKALPFRAVRLDAPAPEAAARALAAAGLVGSEALLLAYLRLLAPGVALEAREHWLGGGQSPRELVGALADRGRATVTVSLPEGRTSFELAQRLEKAGVCRGQSFLAAAQDPLVLTRLGVSARTAEGYLFPASYELYLDERPEGVLAKFLRESQRRRKSIEGRFPLGAEHRALGFGWHEVVTLASIVERETAHPAERPKVARVFFNRLLAKEGETGGRLESDPTSLYGCEALGAAAPASCARPGGSVSPALVRDEQNPYGTYRRAGLPPGPIGNPGEAALVAVLRPAPGEELYFVADGQGNHHFSRTFAEHRQAVERLKALRRAGAFPSTAEAAVP